ncbi:hypothetical protein FLLO111716_06520 [Flavobacterium longum]|uniref:ATP-binding protein n=1 Tax=Flavobacterium longum TaxID=1299340 RepID=UPI0039E9E328
MQKIRWARTDADFFATFILSFRNSQTFSTMKKGLILLVLFPTLFYAQEQSQRFRALVDQAFHFTVTDDTDERYFSLLREAETLVQTCHCDSIKFELYVMLAEEVDYRGGNASTYHKKLLDIAKKSKSNGLQARAWSILGHSEMVKRSSKASSYYLNGLTYAKATKDPFLITVLLLENGMFYQWFKQNERARNYYLQAVKYSRDIAQSDAEFNEFTTKNARAYAYTYLSQTLTDDQKAYGYVKEAYRLLGKTDNPLDDQAFKTVSLVLFGLNFKFKKYQEALANNDLLYQIAVRDDDDYYIRAAQVNYALVYTRLKDFQKARTYVDIIHPQVDLADVNINDPLGGYNFNRTFAEVYQETGEKQKAINYLKRELRIMDTLLASKQDRITEDFAAKYETQQRKAEIANQNLIIERQKATRNIIVILSVLAISIIIIAYQRYIGRHRRKELMLDLGLKKEKEINQFRKTFFENVAHEIRTPLTLLRGYLDLAMEHTTSATAKDYLGKAIANSTSLLENTNDMLLLLKSDDADRIGTDQIYINAFVAGIIANFQGNSFFTRIVFTTDISDNTFVKSDRSKLEKILNNLIGNALKYAKESPKIDVSVRYDEGQLRISVKDAGPGIPEHEKDKVFERFYQAESNRDSGGYGIGLSMSKALAVKLGGDITLETAEGQGCVFTISIPVERYQVKKSISEDHDTFEGKVAQSTEKAMPSLLIVEDNPELSLFYKEILSSHFECFFASDGLQGLKLAKSRQFDLVVSDIMMPGLDGFGFRKNLREIPSYAVTPFILVSAKSLTRDKIEGFGLGIDDFISKPFNKDELIARLKTLLENVENRRQWALENKDQVLPPDKHFEETLLSGVDRFVLARLSDETLSTQDVAAALGYHPRKLTSEVKRLTGMGLVQYISEIRLREAYLLLVNKSFPTVSEVSYAVGMESTSYFNKLFKARYGITPGELMHS